MRRKRRNDRREGELGREIGDRRRSEGTENWEKRRRNEDKEKTKRGGPGEEEEEEEEVHQVLLPTEEELSEWHSPPRQQQSAQTQTGPAGRHREEGRTKRNNVRRRSGS